MSGRVEIQPRDIRAGDLIREERSGEGQESDPSVVAVEYVATRDRNTRNRFTGERTYYLLDRPAPVVELPTEPTLGWTEYRLGGDSVRRLGCTFNLARCVRLSAWDVDVAADWVTAFTPATAVPTEALDELRAPEGVINGAGLALAVHRRRRIETFLAAIDEASRP